MKVCQFIDQENGAWKGELLEQCQLDFEAAKVRKITLCRSQQSDILTWPFNADGEYTVKFGYQFFLAEIHRQQPGLSSSDSLKPLWQAIWQVGNWKYLAKSKFWFGEHAKTPFQQRWIWWNSGLSRTTDVIYAKTNRKMFIMPCTSVRNLLNYGKKSPYGIIVGWNSVTTLLIYLAAYWLKIGTPLSSQWSSGQCGIEETIYA